MIRIEKILPQFSPCLVALALTGLLVTFTNSLPGEKKLTMQFSIFAAMLAGGIAMLLQNSPEKFSAFWAQFIVLPPFVRFAMTAVFISITYFGGALYSIGLSGNKESGCSEGSLSSPALADSAVDFEVPANLPDNDKVFFEQFFEKYDKLLLWQAYNV